MGGGGWVEVGGRWIEDGERVGKEREGRRGREKVKISLTVFIDP